MALRSTQASSRNEYQEFLISNFRRVLNILCSLLGSYPASELYTTCLPTGCIPPAYEDGTDRVFRNVGIYNSDAGELPKRKHNIVPGIMSWGLKAAGA